MVIFKSIEKWWDNGMGSGNGRKFSLLVSAVWIYTLLMIGIFNKQAHYVAIPLGIFLLILDNHNLKEED